MKKIVATIALLPILGANPAHAFKLNTHAFLAEQVYNDAKDGKVTFRIYAAPGSPLAVKYKNRISKPTEESQKVKFECLEDYQSPSKQWPHVKALETRTTCWTEVTYNIPKVYKDALNAPNGFSAFIQGSLGPDVYPDMATGQTIIHPHEGSSDLLTSQWLARIYHMARFEPKYKSDKSNLAFALGFTHHAIADTYAHTLVNQFAGGPFEIGENAVIHTAVESEIAKYTPNPSRRAFSSRLSNSNLDYVFGATVKYWKDFDRFYNKNNPHTKKSLPFIYQNLRLSLKKDEARFRANADRCAAYDVTCSATINTAKAAYVDAWQKDISSGLKRWVKVSQSAGVYFGFNPNSSIQASKLADLYSDYARDHILSMSGAPDIAGATMKVVGDISDALMPDFILDKVKEMKRDLLDYIVEDRTGKTIDQWKSAYSKDLNTALQRRGVSNVRRSRDYKSFSSPSAFMAYNFMWSHNGSPHETIKLNPWINGPIQLGKVMLLSRSDMKKLCIYIQKNAVPWGTPDKIAEEKCGGVNSPTHYSVATPIWYSSTKKTKYTPGKVYENIHSGGVQSIDNPEKFRSYPYFVRLFKRYIGPMPTTATIAHKKAPYHQ